MASSRLWLFSTLSPLRVCAGKLVLCVLATFIIIICYSGIRAVPPTAVLTVDRPWRRAALPKLINSGVIELIPTEYQQRYQNWKGEYLSTASGREAWDEYAYNPAFALTITISKEQGHGARIDGFRWDDADNLIAATIILGNKLDSGYPSSINYPITCALGPGNLPSEVKGKILAATKLAHEFGHLDQMRSINGTLYRLQNTLMIEYNRIFATNGFNVCDPQLLALAERMGGTPVSISQDREHWAEMGALVYLQERLPELNSRSKLKPIKEAIQSYYSTYPERLQLSN